jgi:hypothetical protein
MAGDFKHYNVEVLQNKSSVVHLRVTVFNLTTTDQLCWNIRMFVIIQM